MADEPAEMLQGTRTEDPEFTDSEKLYRRFSPDMLDGGEIALDAVSLPDMSVIREKYGRPEWLLLSEEHSGWGVLCFRVRDIPPNREIWHEGVIAYRLEPRHVPTRRNYPHSEIWVFCDGVHVCRADKNLHLLDPDFHLRWRECLILASHIAIPPSH